MLPTLNIDCTKGVQQAYSQFKIIRNRSIPFERSKYVSSQILQSHFQKKITSSVLFSLFEINISYPFLTWGTEIQIWRVGSPFRRRFSCIMSRWRLSNQYKIRDQFLRLFYLQSRKHGSCSQGVFFIESFKNTISLWSYHCSTYTWCLGLI